MNPQLVYAVVEYAPDEGGGSLYGIYSSEPRAAQEAREIQAVPRQPNRRQVIVHRVPLNGRPRLYYWGEDNEA